MSGNPEVNTNAMPVAKNQELEPSELEKISGGVPVASTPPPKPTPKPALFEIDDFSFD
jgi:hypothetical protein